MAELLSAGLVERSGTGYRIVDLRDAQQRVLARADDEIARLALMASPPEPTPAPEGTFGPGAEYIQSRDEINKRLDHEVFTARTAILSAQPDVRHAAADRARPRDINALGRGVEMRTLYPKAATGRTPTKQWVREMSALGGEYRVLSSPFSRGIIIDHRVAFVNDPRFPDENRTIVVNDPGVIAVLADIFESAWQRAIGWGAGPQDRGTITTPVQRSILRELIADRTQESAARALGMSRSAVEQQLASLRAALGVKSVYAAIAWFLRSEETELD